MGLSTGPDRGAEPPTQEISMAVPIEMEAEVPQDSSQSQDIRSHDVDLPIMLKKSGGQEEHKVPQDAKPSQGNGLNNSHGPLKDDPVFEIIDDGEDCATLPPHSIAVENFEEMITSTKGEHSELNLGPAKAPMKEYEKPLRQLVEEAAKEESISWHKLSTTQIPTMGDENLKNPLATRFGTVTHGNALALLYSWRSYRECVSASFPAS